ncbi:MAG: GGDEF domain-containing protein [Cycloclasticus sp.]
MTHQNEPKQAAEYLRQVIPMLSRQKLPPTPINYAVFYSYLSGSSQSLNAIIDDIFNQKKTFSLAIMVELYEKYVNGTATLEQQDKIQQALEKALSEASDEVQQITSDAQGFDNNISKHADTLSETTDPATTTIVLKQIMQDTRDMVRNNLDMQARMQDTNDEITRVKAELESVKAMAEKDALTGLKNRGSFDRTIDNIVYGEQAESTSLIILDIDHFKRINDHYGHLVGDRVIRYVAALLLQIIGKENHIARFGGEEFAIILHNESPDSLTALSNKVRIAMGNSKLQRKDSGETIGKVTLSAGITQLKSDDSAETLIERADKALYKAKESGRNKVVFYE